MTVTDRGAVPFHPSHVIENFNDYSPQSESESRFCASCGICECHSPALCAQPCEYADPQPSNKATE